MSINREFLPSSKSMVNHVVEVIADAGGRAKAVEIDRRLIMKLGISDSAAAILHKEGETRTEFRYRSAWARTYCRRMGLITKEPNGFWVISDV